MTATQGTESRTRQSETAAEVVGRLRVTFNTGVTRGLDWRVNQLQQLRALLVENERELIEALWADLRKNPAEAKTQSGGPRRCRSRFEEFMRLRAAQTVLPGLEGGQRGGVVLTQQGAELVGDLLAVPRGVLLSPGEHGEGSGRSLS
jgi:acyl-CoA reductase-like NAD-dependent aldehyde dehydrogenase